MPWHLLQRSFRKIKKMGRKKNEERNKLKREDIYTYLLNINKIPLRNCTVTLVLSMVLKFPDI